MWLARNQDVPVAVLMETDDGYRHARVRLEAAAMEQARAADALRRIRELAAQAETFRGKMLAPAREEAEFGDSPTTLRLARLSPVGREEIVLAPGGSRHRKDDAGALPRGRAARLYEIAPLR